MNYLVVSSDWTLKWGNIGSLLGEGQMDQDDPDGQLIARNIWLDLLCEMNSTHASFSGVPTYWVRSGTLSLNGLCSGHQLLNWMLELWPVKQSLLVSTGRHLWWGKLSGWRGGFLKEPGTDRPERLQGSRQQRPKLVHGKSLERSLERLFGWPQRSFVKLYNSSEWGGRALLRLCSAKMGKCWPTI